MLAHKQPMFLMISKPILTQTNHQLSQKLPITQAWGAFQTLQNWSYLVLLSLFCRSNHFETHPNLLFM